MASRQEIRRRSSAADRMPASPLISCATTTTFANANDAGKSFSDRTSDEMADAAAMPPPPPPPPAAPEDSTPTRHPDPTSPASRNANRLSITLPISLPTSDPTRPTPTSAVPRSSVPPTPVETSGTSTPVDTDDFIIAIAAQERRVLELREELARAEHDLSSLKKKWSTHNPLKKKAEPRYAESPRPAPVAGDDESVMSRLSIDLERSLERRKSLLQGSNNFAPGRRRIIRGGHTRTLSLLSPTKSTDGFSLHEDSDREPLALPPPPVERRATELSNPVLAKRASWQPHTHFSQAGVPQFVEDFRSGLKAFVEDIRQITVGDEPINGQTGPFATQRGNDQATSPSGDHATIRPSNGNAARPRASAAFDLPDSATSTPTPSSKVKDALAKETPAKDKAKLGKSKHFSWTPLSFDSLDDNDWSNWDSPAPAKSPRWSGSTINSGGAEDIHSIPESKEELEEAG
jgi:hypothetical protein